MAANPSSGLPGLEIYFQSKRANLNAQLPTHLVNFITATQQSLDCAIYDLREPSILAALKSVVASGKRVRIAYDNSQPDDVPSTVDPKHGDTEDLLQASGLIRYATPVHASGRHLMHNKFMVRDGQMLWTGSANFTEGGLTKQDNNCLVIQSPQLCADYSHYFESLLKDEHPKGHRGKAAATPIPHDPAVAVGSVRITPYFEPTAGEGIEDTIVAALKTARKVRILAMLISDPGILDALYRFRSSGADIRGVYDAQEMGWTKRSRWLKQESRPLTWFMEDKTRFVGFHSTPYSRTDPNFVADFMHNKVMIIDDHIVLTGSYNFSENAEDNDENLLYIESPQVAAAYTSYFDTLFHDYEQHAVEAEAQPSVSPRPHHAAVAQEAGKPVGRRGKTGPRRKRSHAARGHSPVRFFLVVIVSIVILASIALVGWLVFAQHIIQ